MKTYLSAACIVTVLVAGSALLYNGPVPEPETVPRPETPAPPVEEVILAQPETAQTPARPPEKTIVYPESERTPEPKLELVQKAAEKPKAPKPDYSRYWKQQERRFTRLIDRLAGETDPHTRRNLIEAIARHIRVDTLATLDWAATLETAEEQRIAFEAINNNALVGIGAHIEVDKTGLPLIRETTIMSAVESTGMVAAGDYISGMIHPDGTAINFENMPLHQIVRHLRGKVGTEPTLMMKRRNPDGSTLSFDVAVPRSLLVVGPPNSIN